MKLLLLGVALFIGIGLSFGLYLNSSSGQVLKCMALYESASKIVKHDPEIIVKMKEEGFSSIEEMIEDRCKFWVKNGQTF